PVSEEPVSEEPVLEEPVSEEPVSEEIVATAVDDYKSISGTDIKPLLKTDDEYITSTRVETSTGTAPFDLNEDSTENNTPGNDGSAENKIVRSFDSYTYKVYVNSANYTDGVAYEKGYIHYRFVLPATKEEAEFETDSMAWMSTEKGYEWNIKDDVIDGVSCQVLTCSRLLTTAGSVAKNALPCTEASANIVIRVKGMKNASVIGTKGWAWMDCNDVDEDKPDHICSDQKHRAAHNGGKEMVAFDLPAVTVSAAPMYNITIQEHAYKNVYSTFDFSTGNEFAQNKDAGEVPGQLRGVSMYISLYNQPADKGFKGIELPDETKPITFDLKLSAEYRGDETVNITPLMWTADDNASGTEVSSYDGRNMKAGGSYA
ncbi:MAG: hypothetical protein HUJ76_13255, partial [Parasporobacterium sp.]|nr:hypothetical protein [Parasporobacterium sp.]